jgi:adenosine deaminase
MCILRHLPAADGLKHFEEAVKAGYFEDGSLVGIGLDSSEKEFPPSWFKEIYQRAKELGIRRTAHAGEEGPPEFITSALDDLHVERIDHGVRAVEDATLLSRLAKEKILLTVCPISNVALRVVSHVSEVPIRKLMDAGVRWNINGDDPAYFTGPVDAEAEGVLMKNYCAVQEAFGLTVAEWEKVARDAIQGSFASESRKEEVEGLIDRWIGGWRGRL